MKKTEIEMFTYSDDTVSDLYKCAYGIRPTQSFWYAWERADKMDKQDVWNALCRDADRAAEEQQRCKELALEQWEVDINTFTKFAGTRESALRWMTQEEKFHNSQDVEHWVYKQGILFTSEGDDVIKQLCKIFL